LCSSESFRPRVLICLGRSKADRAHNLSNVRLSRGRNDYIIYLSNVRLGRVHVYEYNLTEVSRMVRLTSAVVETTEEKERRGTARNKHTQPPITCQGKLPSNNFTRSSITKSPTLKVKKQQRALSTRACAIHTIFTICYKKKVGDICESVV